MTAQSLTLLLKRYLLICGLVFNLLALVASYYFLKQVRYSADNFPQAMMKISTALQTDYPSVNLISKPLEKVAYYFYKPDRYSGQTLPSNIVNLGPNNPDLYNLISNEQNSSLLISSSEQLIKALKEVKPGQTLLLKNGIYNIKSRSVKTSATIATKEKPITLKALNIGKAIINLNSSEGLHILSPYWRINGIRFNGTCQTDNWCDHALHIVGSASNIEITNNQFSNFNAAIKVNELNGVYPDNGKISNNHFYSDSPRKTKKSVTPINIDHANNWVISNNIIQDFVKSAGDKVSYGAFIKGGSIGGIFENNLVICSTSNNKYRGSTVGLSIGGGGMSQKNRRDKSEFEAKNITIRNNIIMFCSDVGLYVNKGSDSLINNNTFYNTQGIDIRFQQSSATLVNNILSGKIRSRDHASVFEFGNLIWQKNYWRGSEQLNDIFVNPAAIDFSIMDIDLLKHSKDIQIYPFHQLGIKDFCGNTIEKNDLFLGAFKSSRNCF